MRDGVLSSTVCFQHSMRLRLVETSSSLPTARVSGRSSRGVRDRVVGVDAAPEMRELALAKLQDAGKSNVELWVHHPLAGRQIKTITRTSLRSGFRTFPRPMPTGPGAAFHDALRPGGRRFPWMRNATISRGTTSRLATARARERDELRGLEDGRASRIIRLSSEPARLARDPRDAALTRTLTEQARSSPTVSAAPPLLPHVPTPRRRMNPPKAMFCTAHGIMSLRRRIAPHRGAPGP